METLETDALVMRHLDWSESSKIVSFYTKDHGLIKLIARSAKKKNNKFLGVIEPCQFIHIFYDFKPNRQLNYLKEADIIKDNYSLVSNSNAYYIFLAIIELISKSLDFNDAQSDLYDELFTLRHEISQNKAEKISFISFLFKYFEILGYKLDLNHCSNCDNKELTQIQFDLKTGIRCQNCLLEHIDNDFNAKIYQLFVYSTQNKYAEFTKDISDLAFFKTSYRLLLSYLSFHIDKKIELSSLDFVT